MGLVGGPQECVRTHGRHHLPRQSVILRLHKPNPACHCCSAQHLLHSSKGPLVTNSKLKGRVKQQLQNSGVHHTQQTHGISTVEECCCALAPGPHFFSRGPGVRHSNLTPAVVTNACCWHITPTVLPAQPLLLGLHECIWLLVAWPSYTIVLAEGALALSFRKQCSCRRNSMFLWMWRTIQSLL